MTETAITGTGVVAGIAYAPAVWVHPRPELPQAGQTVAEDKRGAEYDRFVEAADAVAARLAERAANSKGQAAEVLVATAGMVRDRGWRKTVKKNIQVGHPADYAAVAATDKFVAMFESAGGLMAERTTDLKDVRDRVIAQLRGEQEPGLPSVTEPSVLLADDLSPADTAGLDPEMFVALATELGGPTSHTSIIARQLGVPCIAAVGAHLRDIEAGTPVRIDGGTGTILLGADPEKSRALVEESSRQLECVAQWRGPLQTTDGHRVQLLANVADGKAARQAAQRQVEGVGLYRTELSFLGVSAEPTVEEQSAIYREVFDAFPGQKVVVRTLDAGSDKPIEYATMTKEDNPALGVRGLRIARSNEALLTSQLDAIAAAAADRGDDVQTWVMAPMVATSFEAEWFADLCRKRGLIPGAMIEVPAAALMADKIMPHLGFVSIGTNDLTQYTMAADRLSPQLAYLTDPWQPAVLRLIRHTCIVAADNQIPVGVCGEAAADPLLACVLTGLGVKSLSAASSAVAAVGAMVSEYSVAECQRIALAAIEAEGAVEAREAARAVVDEIRGGANKAVTRSRR